MKKILISLLILLSLSACSESVNTSDIELSNLQAIRNIETDGVNMYSLVLISENYVVEKYNFEGVLIDSYLINFNSVNIDNIELFVKDSVVAVYLSLYDENNIYIHMLDEDMKASNILSLTYNESLSGLDNSIFIDDSNLYLINSKEIVKYDINENVLSESIRTSLSVVSIDKVDFSENLFIIVSTENSEFTFADNQIATSTNKELIKVSSELILLENVSLEDSLDISGLNVNDKVFVYGKTFTKPFINEYDLACALVNSFELNLTSEGFIYGVNGLQFRDGEIFAVLEGTNSNVSIYKVDLIGETIKEVFSKGFLFDNPNLKNILEISDDYVFIDNKDYLVIINK